MDEETTIDRAHPAWARHRPFDTAVVYAGLGDRRSGVRLAGAVENRGRLSSPIAGRCRSWTPVPESLASSCKRRHVRARWATNGLDQSHSSKVQIAGSQPTFICSSGDLPR